MTLLGSEFYQKEYEFSDNFNSLSQYMNDKDLIELLKKEDNAAFKYAYKQYFPMIQSYVSKNSGSLTQAQDLFQETMIVFIKNLRKPAFKLTAKISSYLYAIARKMWLYQLRGKKDIQSLDAREDKEHLIGAVDVSGVAIKQNFEDKHYLAQKVLKTLSEECRQLILLFYYKKQSLEIIRQELNYTKDFIKVKKKRCMDGFKRNVAAHPDFQTLQH